MGAIEPCSRSRGKKRDRVLWNYVRTTNSTSIADDEGFTTITTTLVATVVIPVPTKTTTSTLTLDSTSCTPESTSRIHLILPSSSVNRPSSTILPNPSQPIPSSLLPSTAEAHLSSRRPSALIIGIIVTIIILLFILASYFAWHKRRRRPLITSSVGDRPSLLPKFSFERENEGPLKTSGTFVDKSTILDKTHSPGVRSVADDHHGTPNHTIQSKASRTSMLLLAQSFGPSLTKATVVNTFITDLTDELPVAVGQKLNVLAEYDDGWTFCVNDRGEQGMVPIECLQKEKKV